MKPAQRALVSVWPLIGWKSGARFFSQSRQPTARFSLIISPADPPSKEHSLVLLAFYFWLEPGSWPQRNQLDWGRYFWPRNKTELTQQVSCLESDTPCNADARIWDKHKCWTLILRMELATYVFVSLWFWWWRKQWLSRHLSLSTFKTVLRSI